MNHYDIIIVGAGINGCSLARSLHLRGKKVLVLDQDDIASGGSGAAGAFINPKISKSGPLKELIEEAYLFSLDFYRNNFSEMTTFAPLLHISKYEDENDKVEYFKDKTQLAIDKIPAELEAKLTEYAKAFSSVFLRDNAVLEAKEVCTAMLEGIDFHQLKVQEPLYEKGMWHIKNYKAHRLVLCTGAYDEICKEEYLKLRRIYGQRCEVKSTTVMDATVHHEISVSVTKKNGHIAIGASHYLNESDLPSEQQGAEELIALAKKSVRLEDIELVKTLSGMRSGSNDYLPIIGRLIDADKSIEADDSALQGNKSARLIAYPELYVINGVGGYGFVLGPYLAELMSDHLVDAKKLPEYLKTKRFYYRWAKKRGQR